MAFNYTIMFFSHISRNTPTPVSGTEASQAENFKCGHCADSLLSPQHYRQGPLHLLIRKPLYGYAFLLSLNRTHIICIQNIEEYNLYIL
jgi:hypothetical protein